MLRQNYSYKKDIDTHSKLKAKKRKKNKTWNLTKVS